MITGPMVKSIYGLNIESTVYTKFFKDRRGSYLVKQLQDFAGMLVSSIRFGADGSDR